MKTDLTLAIVGGGPSALFTLRHLLADLGAIGGKFALVHVFERGPEFGPGMPYSRTQTSVLNLSNISSEELPSLPEKFADWLRNQPRAALAELGIEGEIREDEIYPRVALGAYFRAQFDQVCAALEEQGLPVLRHADSEVGDIRPTDGGYEVVTGSERFPADVVVIATGHVWPADEDEVNFSSPWPIRKLLPKNGGALDFPVGLLGASLSAVDVINVLAHHHGRFVEEDGFLKYLPDPACGDFRLVMHSADGLLSHLQFEQIAPKRELFRHCSEEEIEALRDPDGHLRLDVFFDRICRPALVRALEDDGMPDEASATADSAFAFSDFTAMMKQKHLSDDPFAMMKKEFVDARAKIKRRKPTRWKEVLDDLMYTLNFHAGLLPAEDHARLRSEILPFVMNVMAALPLPSAKILMAVHEAGRLDLIHGKAEVRHEPGEATAKVTVGEKDERKTFEYRMFIDCSGQSPVDKKSFPFPSLAEARLVKPSEARVTEDGPPEVDPEKLHRAGDGTLLMELGGMSVAGDYQLLSADGRRAPGLYDIAVPHVAGLRPYCYGLQACDEAAKILVTALGGKAPPIANPVEA